MEDDEETDVGEEDGGGEGEGDEGGGDGAEDDVELLGRDELQNMDESLSSCL